MIFLLGQASGLLPTTSALASATVPIPGGASNALVDSSTMYVVGQQPQTRAGADALWRQSYRGQSEHQYSVSSSGLHQRWQPGATSRMIEADDNTLWIAMTGCTTGVRYATSAAGGYGCLTMYNTSTNTVTMLEPYIGDATGIAAVTGLHKIYTAEGGQVYIYSTVDGSSIDNQYVTVTGTAYDVAYMDAITDTDNHRLLIPMPRRRPPTSEPMSWPSPLTATTWNRPAGEPSCAWRRAACAPPFSI